MNSLTSVNNFFFFFSILLFCHIMIHFSFDRILLLVTSSKMVQLMKNFQLTTMNWEEEKKMGFSVLFSLHNFWHSFFHLFLFISNVMLCSSFIHHSFLWAQCLFQLKAASTAVKEGLLLQRRKAVKVFGEDKAQFG